MKANSAIEETRRRVGKYARYYVYTRTSSTVQFSEYAVQRIGSQLKKILLELFYLKSAQKCAKLTIGKMSRYVVPENDDGGNCLSCCILLLYLVWFGPFFFF